MSLFLNIAIALCILYVLFRVVLYIVFRVMRRRVLRRAAAMGGGVVRELTRRPLEGLDASRFEPAAGDEMRDFAGVFGPSWLRSGRESMDRIPSTNVPRTQLIDRAMIGLGLITQEEVAEAHRLGELVDKATGDQRLALEQAEGEAFRTLEDRAAAKEQKKAEAATRRELRARQVAHRRQNDIVFLGRGVSNGLADRRANVEKLEAAGLPILATPADLAEAMGLAIPRLRWLAYHSEASRVTHYTRFVVPKKSGGSRALFSPHRDMASAQRWILQHILSKASFHHAAHGFVGGRNTVTNAVPHVGKDLVVNVDVKDFFPSVTFPRVKGIFQGLGYSPAVSVILALLCTECPRRTVEYDGVTHHVACGLRALPQGASTSPALSNLVARRLDARLSGLSHKLGWTYTRYADDMTFSAQGEPAKQVGYLLARVRHLVADEGFRLNEKKTRVLKRSTAQTVTGIVVNARPAVSRKESKRIRAILHNAKRYGLSSQNRKDHPNFEGWLSGMIAYHAMVSPEKGQALKKEFAQIRR